MKKYAASDERDLLLSLVTAVWVHWISKLTSAQYPPVSLDNRTVSTTAALAPHTMPGDCDLEAARNLYIMFARLKVKICLALESEVLLATRGHWALGS